MHAGCRAATCSGTAAGGTVGKTRTPPTKLKRTPHNPAAPADTDRRCGHRPQLLLELWEGHECGDTRLGTLPEGRAALHGQPVHKAQGAAACVGPTRDRLWGLRSPHLCTSPMGTLTAGTHEVPAHDLCTPCAHPSVTSLLGEEMLACSLAQRAVHLHRQGQSWRGCPGPSCPTAQLRERPASRGWNSIEGGPDRPKDGKLRGPGRHSYRAFLAFPQALPGSVAGGGSASLPTPSQYWQFSMN